MDEHRHDFINRKCIICGIGQWRCLTCGYWLAIGEQCYLPWCVDNRIMAARYMGWLERPGDLGYGMPDATGTP